MVFKGVSWPTSGTLSCNQWHKDSYLEEERVNIYISFIRPSTAKMLALGTTHHSVVVFICSLGLFFLHVITVLSIESEKKEIG